MRKMINAQAQKNKALALLRENRLAEARDQFVEVCKIDPEDAESWFRLGTTNLELKALPQAEACFRRVIELRPSLDIAYYNLGRCLEFQARDDEAMAVYRKLVQITPHIEAYKNIGVLYEEQGKFAEALDIYHQAIAIQPDNPRLIVAEAGIYEKQGDYDRAYECIRPFLESGRETPEIAMMLAALSRHLNCETQAIDLMERLLTGEDWSGRQDVLVSMHFTLGRLHDAAGNYELAFNHFQHANNLRGHAFNSAAHAKWIDAIINTFNLDFIQKAPHATIPADHLIFIIGMPRSGTTLVEQILGSHPQVYGCGELSEIANIINSLPELLGTKEQYPQAATFLTADSCTKLAQRYLQRVSKFSGDADFITDKMPQNFIFLGMIAILFPGAKVIHCIRDPIDTCLSCYFQAFRHHHTAMSFTSNLTHLGEYYRQYQRLMQHWKTTLDIAMMDISYELLVADQEKFTRQMLEFCGLPWDERCLTFYDSGRAVTTASYTQVREPIYQKSVQRWKHYEPFLQPLKTALYSDGT